MIIALVASLVLTFCVLILLLGLSLIVIRGLLQPPSGLPPL